MKNKIYSIEKRKKDGKCNYVDSKGNYLSKRWFVSCEDFREGFAVVQREDGKFNYLTKRGKILSKEWFENCYAFNDGVAIVNKDYYSTSFITKEGKIFDQDNITMIKLDNKINFVSRLGDIIFKENVSESSLSDFYR